VLAAAVLGVQPAPTCAALKMIWGPNQLPDGSSAFPVYRRLGVEVLEQQVSWRDVATARPAHPRDPRDPAYRWPSSVDQAVVQARAAGIRVAIMVTQSPDWANGGRGPARVPDDVGDYANFVVAAARRYSTVRHWMIWGEPTRFGSFAPQKGKRGARAYARLLDRAYGALKHVSKRNIVIGGMTWTLGTIPPQSFVRWLRLPSGKPPRLDYYGHNPFSTRFPRLGADPYYKGLRDMSDVDTLAHEVRRAYRSRHRAPKLWLSEFTVSSDHASRAFSFFVSRRAQARWLAAAYRIAARERYIAALGWYSLLDEVTTDPDPLTTGLMTADGRPKPAFFAYRRARGSAAATRASSAAQRSTIGCQP
jgi:hypothetical protein